MMDHKTTFNKATNILCSNPKLEKQLIDLFGDTDFWEELKCGIIIGAAENSTQFGRYYRAPFSKYYNIYEAIYSISDNNILVYFADLNLYAIVDSLVEFKNFTKSARDLIEDGESFNINQIVLEDKKQKLVFVSTDDDEHVVQQITKYVKSYLGADVSVIKGIDTQIMVNDKLFESYDNALMNYTDLHEHIAEKDRNIAKVISMIPRIRKSPYKYTAPTISDAIYANTVEDLVKILSSIPAGFIAPVNITINNIGGNQNNYNSVPKKSSRNIASEWIKNNLPTEKEVTTDYYNRYSGENKTAIHINQFGKLVRDEGYETARTTNGNRYWKK